MEYKIRITTAQQAGTVDMAQWISLEKSAVYVNPFYEHWNLLPALKHLCADKPIYLVQAYNQAKKLVALFPVEVKTGPMSQCYLQLWRHDHCYLTTPLIKREVDFYGVLKQVVQKLSAIWCHIPLHHPDLISYTSPVFSRLHTRGAVMNTGEITDITSQWDGKCRRENHRILRRAREQQHYEYSEHYRLSEGLAEYADLEMAGWKGACGGAMLNRKTVYDYYQDMMHLAEGKNIVSFQTLTFNHKLVAAGIRLASSCEYFDIKTTYNEKYKSRYPGKVLELENLDRLCDLPCRLLDSCTVSENRMINKLWPHRRILFDSLVFFNFPKSKAMKTMYLVKSWVKKQKIIRKYHETN